MRKPSNNTARRPQSKRSAAAPEAPADKPATEGAEPKEVGGRGGLEPTRYGDWEVKGICVDF